LGRNMRGSAVAMALTAMILSATAFGLEKEPSDQLLAAEYSMVGIRLGAWISNQGPETSQDLTVETNMPDAGFYTELFLDYRLASVLFLEGSLGIASRGDAVIEDVTGRYIGTINLYQALFQVKFSPLSGKSKKFLPFVVVGGGVAWGRQSIDYIVSYSYYYNPEITNRTEADFLPVIGGGIDFPVAEQIGLNIAVKYHPIKFNDALAGVKNFSGTAVSLGVAYYFHKK
jgi:outer membrane protein W